MASRFFISKQLRPFLIRSKSVKLLYCHKCDYSDETQKGEDSKKYSERKRKSEKRFSEIFESSNSDFNFEVKPQPYRKAAATYNPQKFQTLLQTLIAQPISVKQSPRKLQSSSSSDLSSPIFDLKVESSTRISEKSKSAESRSNPPFKSGDSEFNENFSAIQDVSLKRDVGSRLPWLRYEDEDSESEFFEENSQKLSEPTTPIIEEGQRLPRIDSNFSTCESYLTYVLQNVDFELNSQDWQFILGEIVETLPAFNFEKIVTYQIVVPHSKDAFVFSVCRKARAYDAALSYYEFLKSEDCQVQLAEVPRGTLFRLMASCDRRTLEPDTARGRRFKSICDETVQIGPQHFHATNLVSFISGLANTPDWKTALELSKLLVGKEGVCYAFRSLALAALHYGDEKVFWKILNSSQFHQDIINVREANPGGISEYQDDVFIAYLKHCQLLALEKDWSFAWTELEKLFSYFRDIFHCIRPAVQAELESTVKSLRKFKEETPKETTISKNRKCTICLTDLDSAKFEKSEISELCEAVTSRILYKGDVYQTSNPLEIERFNKKLASVGSYDVIVDGLNVALARWPGVRMKNLNQQSISLFETLKVLEKLSMKTLLIHRPILRRYPHFPEMADMCDYLTFDNVSEDDPFVLIAALSSGPNTFFVTNDTLRQHFHLLKDTNLMKLFTSWQLSRQIIFFQQVEAIGRKSCKVIPNLYFPPLHSSSVCRSETHWHLPLDHRCKIDEGHQRNLVFPKSWLCVPVPKRSSESFENLANL